MIVDPGPDGGGAGQAVESFEQVGAGPGAARLYLAGLLPVDQDPGHRSAEPSSARVVAWPPVRI